MSQQPAYQYDVFLSYSSDDRDWVRGELLQRLEDSGIKICIDFRDFIIGMPAIKNMEQAVLTSCKTLLTISLTLILPTQMTLIWLGISY
jgi:hypothetical protein